MVSENFWNTAKAMLKGKFIALVKGEGWTVIILKSISAWRESNKLNSKEI